MTAPTARHLARRRGPRATTRPRERGLVLVTGMLFLVVFTLLALTLFRSSGLLERIAANTRDKQRSFEAAQAALQYAEYWISQGNGGMGTACGTGLVDGTVTANIHVCSNALSLSTATTLPWTAGYYFKPANLTAPASGYGSGGQTAGGDINYYTYPGFYIEYLGIGTDGKSTLYQVTAYGYGGMRETGTVVRSTYQMTPKVTDLGAL